MAPWKMLPPVRLKVRSRSSGVSTWRAITELLQFGAYSLSKSKQRSAKLSRKSSQLAPWSLYGAYWMNIDIKCLPGGATDGSTAEGMVHSRIGFSDGRPYLASS